LGVQIALYLTDTAINPVRQKLGCVNPTPIWDQWDTLRGVGALDRGLSGLAD